MDAGQEAEPARPHPTLVNPKPQFRISELHSDRGLTLSWKINDFGLALSSQESGTSVELTSRLKSLLRWRVLSVAGLGFARTRNFGKNKIKTYRRPQPVTSAVLMLL